MITLHFCHPRTRPPDLTLLHIQARPQAWVRQIAPRSVPVLIPSGSEVQHMMQLVADRRAGRAPDPEVERLYRMAYVMRLMLARKRRLLDPEVLRDDQGEPISGSVALCCTCQPEEARAGRCHRAWAAGVLALIPGYQVLLDGSEVEP